MVLPTLLHFGATTCLPLTITYIRGQNRTLPHFQRIRANDPLHHHNQTPEQLVIRSYLLGTFRLPHRLLKYCISIHQYSWNTTTIPGTDPLPIIHVFFSSNLWVFHVKMYEFVMFSCSFPHLFCNSSEANRVWLDPWDCLEIQGGYPRPGTGCHREGLRRIPYPCFGGMGFLWWMVQEKPVSMDAMEVWNSGI